MEMVNQALARIGEWNKSLSPGARLTAALAAVAIVASGVWLFGRQVAPGHTYLMGGESFSASQLRDIESALGQANLNSYQIDGSRVRVPHGEQARYMAALAEAGALPADFGEYMRKAVDDSGFMLSGSRQEAQLKVAVQQELQGVINHFQGIERSFVQIAEEVNQGFPRTKTVTASVGIEPSPREPLDERTVSAIRCIVANAWGGLKPENVTVVDLQTRRLFSGPIAAPADGNYAETKKRLEQDWQEKIARALNIPGAIVTANVELKTESAAPCCVTVAIAVPQSHYAELWRRQHGQTAGNRATRPDPAAYMALEQTESQRIKQAVSTLLSPADPSVERTSLVAVSTIYPASAPAATEESFEALAARWIVANWQNLGLGALVLVAVFLLRSMFRPAPAPAFDATLDEPQRPLGLMAQDEPEVAAPEAVQPLGNHRQRELTDRVRRDPQAAARVLKTWIGNAS